VAATRAASRRRSLYAPRMGPLMAPLPRGGQRPGTSENGVTFPVPRQVPDREMMTLIGRGCARRHGSDHWLVIARFPWREYADIIKTSCGH
jgi:hypothetical protein